MAPPLSFRERQRLRHQAEDQPKPHFQPVLCKSLFTKPGSAASVKKYLKAGSLRKELQQPDGFDLFIQGRFHFLQPFIHPTHGKNLFRETLALAWRMDADFNSYYIPRPGSNGTVEWTDEKTVMYTIAQLVYCVARGRIQKDHHPGLTTRDHIEILVCIIFEGLLDYKEKVHGGAVHWHLFDDMAYNLPSSDDEDDTMEPPKKKKQVVLKQRAADSKVLAQNPGPSTKSKSRKVQNTGLEASDGQQLENNNATDENKISTGTIMPGTSSNADEGESTPGTHLENNIPRPTQLHINQAALDAETPAPRYRAPTAVMVPPNRPQPATREPSQSPSSSSQSSGSDSDYEPLKEGLKDLQNDHKKELASVKGQLTKKKNKIEQLKTELEEKNGQIEQLDEQLDEAIHRNWQRSQHVRLLEEQLRSLRAEPFAFRYDDDDDDDDDDA
ncbi:hypothetical protein Q7P37_010816 [Cladosporium fusiforme]